MPKVQPASDLPNGGAELSHCFELADRAVHVCQSMELLTSGKSIFPLCAHLWV